MSIARHQRSVRVQTVWLSTTAAITAMLHTVRSTLTDNDSVHVFSFDFFKAFDTVRHATESYPPHYVRRTSVSMSRRHPGQHYSRLGDRYGPPPTSSPRLTCIRFTTGTGSSKSRTTHIYLVVPGVNTDTCQEEIDHIQTWAADNNLKLNRNKTKEIVFSSCREGAPPPPCPNIQRVTT